MAKTPGRPVSKVTGVRLEAALLRRLRALGARADPAQVGALADGQQDPVAVDRELGPGRRLGPASAGGVGLAELVPDELDTGHLAGLVVDDDPRRAGLEDGLDAFLDRLVDLVGGRHVLHVAAVDEGHLGRALADRGAGAVHRGEAAADDDDPLPGVARIGQPEGGRLEVLEPVDDAVGVLVRDPELVRVVAADRDEDGVEALALEVVQGEVAPERLTADDLPAEPGDRLVLGLEDLDLREAVLGDPVAEHPARRRVALEDGHVVAGQEEVVGGAHPGRAGADDRRPAAGPGLRLERQRGVDPVVEHRLEDLVAGVAVAVADGDRLVDLVASAVLLARCRADPAEDARERDRPLEDPGRFAPVALGVLLQEARDVDVAGALVLAGRQAVGVVVAEDELEVRGPQPADLLGLGGDLHPGLGRPRAADRRVLLALDLDDAHPARSEAGQLRLVAQRRDLDPVVPADLEDRLALATLDQAPVDLDPDDRRRRAGAGAPASRGDARRGSRTAPRCRARGG